MEEGANGRQFQGLRDGRGCLGLERWWQSRKRQAELTVVLEVDQ